MHRASAVRVRTAIASAGITPEAFRSSIQAVPPDERDAWLDDVLGLDELPDDGPELPRGCTPYLPCSVDVLTRMAEQARLHAGDVFVDVGSGAGRALVFTHLWTGAVAIGLEVQSELVRGSIDLAARLNLSRVSVVQGDAVHLGGAAAFGSVFLLYCPFGGDRLAALLKRLHDVARARPIRVCCVDLPLPPLDWLGPVGVPAGDLAVYESVTPLG